MSKIEDEVCKKIQERAKIGKAKYGVTMERDDLTVVEWLKHLQEEMMDAIVYAERVLDIIDVDVDAPEPEDD
jgi:hypothetical protein